MLILYIFSIDLEKLFGPKKIIEFYLISGVLAALFHNITLNSNLIALASLLDKDLTMVGASGSVWGIMTIYAFTFPDRYINLFFLPISIKVKSLILFFLFVEIFSAITPSISDQTSHFAHIGGAVAGGLIHFLYNKKGLG
jgi:rhomboid-like protein